MYEQVLVDVRYIRRLIDERTENKAENNPNPVSITIDGNKWILLNEKGQYCILSEHPSEKFIKTKEYKDLSKNIESQNQKHAKWSKPTKKMIKECIWIYRCIRNHKYRGRVYMQWGDEMKHIDLQRVAKNMRQVCPHSKRFCLTILENSESILAAIKRNIPPIEF